ncbi:BA75_01319T0 [Komagataella pastoris]|uniref:BA75_01319T0 n=1 Tax=Komagataella pastoris TaxID=4922 RepID=A0A1B2J919_PICPA|nr:BA75_01319T0 [Komagataella pastoris]
MSEEEQQQTNEKVIDLEKRMFVGNIDYDTTEEELRELITGFDIEGIEIPKRFSRRVGKLTGRGFAFVTFASSEETAKAITEFEGKNLKGRDIYCKSAKLKSTEEKTKKKKSNKKKNSAAKNNDGTTTTDGVTAVDGTEESQADVSSNADSASDSVADSKDKENSAPNGGKKKKPYSKKKQNPHKVPLEQGTPSETSIFIRNLHQEVVTSELTEFLSEYDPQWVSIPRRNIPRHVVQKLRKENIPIRSRGMAFVRFADHETQQRALKELNGKEIKGKPISIDIAIDSFVKEEPKESSVKDGSDVSIVTNGGQPQDEGEEEAKEEEEAKSEPLKPLESTTIAPEVQTTTV